MAGSRSLIWGNFTDGSTVDLGQYGAACATALPAEPTPAEGAELTEAQAAWYESEAGAGR